MPILSAKIIFFSILAKNYWKIEIELPPHGAISLENQFVSSIFWIIVAMPNIDMLIQVSFLN